MSRLLLLALLALGLVPSAWAAHPWHSTFAEVELNAKTGKLEVALRVAPIQLEEALRRFHRQHVVLEKTEGIDRLIAEYLVKTFQVKTAQGKPAAIEWVGKEIDIKAVWLYFEMPLPGGLVGAELSQQTFFELAEDQANVIELRQGVAKAALRFERGKAKMKIGASARSADSPPRRADFSPLVPPSNRQPTKNDPESKPASSRDGANPEGGLQSAGRSFESAPSEGGLQSAETAHESATRDEGTRTEIGATSSSARGKLR